MHNSAVYYDGNFTYWVVLYHLVEDENKYVLITDTQIYKFEYRVVNCSWRVLSMVPEEVELVA